MDNAPDPKHYQNVDDFITAYQHWLDHLDKDDYDDVMADYLDPASIWEQYQDELD